MSKIDKPTNEASAMQALQYVCTPDLVNDAKQIISEAQNLPTVSAQFQQLSWSRTKDFCVLQMKKDVI